MLLRDVLQRVTGVPPGSAAPDAGRIEALHFATDGSLLPTPEGTDHFTFLGLPRRLVLDVGALREAFYALSRRFHPDYFGQADAGQRVIALGKSAQLNGAWRTLSEPQPRAEYLLSLVAPHISPGKAVVPPHLLEEMMEIQEAGEELRAARVEGNPQSLAAAEARVRPLREQAIAARKSLEADLASAFGAYDAAAAAHGDASPPALGILASIRGMLDQMNYLRTVIRNLK